MTLWSTWTAQLQGTGLVGGSQSNRLEGLCPKTVDPTVMTSRLTMEVEAVTYNTVTSLAAWRTDYTCHHSHRLNEPPAKGGVWNRLPWLAHTHAVFGYKDFCGSTVLGTPESVGMNGQRDWQAQKVSHLVCCLAGQRCSEVWGTFWTWTGHSIAALITWRREWRKEAANISFS